MWIIINRFGIIGIEKYETQQNAERACWLRNSLINQGWKPRKVAG